LNAALVFFEGAAKAVLPDGYVPCVAQLLIVGHELVRTPQNGYDDWCFRVQISDGDDSETIKVTLSETQRAIAGLAEPPWEWIEARLQRRASARISNYHPTLDQVRRWETPVVLFADPR
jgi:hypothetical protein